MSGVCTRQSADGHLAQMEEGLRHLQCVCVGRGKSGEEEDVAGGQRVKGEMRLETVAEARLGSAYQAILKTLTFVLKIEAIKEL